MPVDLNGARVLLTGATGGIGNAIARGLHGRGAHVLLTGRRLDALVELVDSLGERAEPLVADLSDRDAVASLTDRAGHVDVLVNNAGITLRKPLLELSLDEWHTVVDANLTSTYVVTRAVAPGMIERGGGKIVNVCSVTSELARETIAAYAAAKGGLKMLTRAMCSEWARYGIQANAIAPGYFETDLTEPLRADGAFDAWLRARVPAGRWGIPDELGGAVVFFASSASDYVNGQILYVDGGLTAVV
jgi:gluconate 5-dehydrogenase